MTLDSENPYMLATDSANMQAGATNSLLENTYNYVGSALVSGIASIYNTGADMLGAERVDTAKWLMENDASMGEFYKQNQNAADIGGFIATSLIPGGIALKALKLAKAGTLIGPYGRALGYFSNARDASLKAALEELGAAGGSIYTQINRNKLAAMAWGTADQVLQVAAFETAVAATMKASPLLDKADWLDTTGEILKSSAAFGVLGGALEALAINSVYKGASKLIEPEIAKYRRLVKTETAYDMPTGNHAYKLLESMLELPQEGKNIDYLHKLLPTKDALVLPTKEAFERTARQTTQQAWEEFRLLANKMTGGDTELGQEFARFIETKVTDNIKAGVLKDQTLEELQGYLLNVDRITRVEANASEGPSSIFYVAKQIPAEKLVTVKTVDDLLGLISSRAPSQDTRRQAYKLIGDAADVKVALIGAKTVTPVEEGAMARFATPEEAYAAGFDAVVKRDGTLGINAKSQRLRHSADPIIAPRQYFNFQTGSFSFTAHPTIADLATPARPLGLVGDNLSIVAGTQSPRTMKIFDAFDTVNLDSIDASARYAWLGMKKGESYAFPVVPAKIADTDIPMLERIFQEGAEKWKDTRIVSADGAERTVADVGDFGAYLKDAKLQMLQAHLVATPEDLVSLGVKFNTTPAWIENAIANNFANVPALDTGFSIGLSKSLNPANVEVAWDFSGNVRLSKQLTSAPGAIVTPGVTLPKNANAVMLQQVPDGVGNSIYGILGANYAIKVGQDQASAAVAAVLGADRATKMVKWDANTVINTADQRGAGPGVLSFANADYGDALRAGSQYQGQLTNIWIRDRANATLTTFQPLMVKIADSKEAAAELGILNTALRRTGEQFVIHPDDASLLINKKAIRSKQDGTFIVDEDKLKSLEAQGIKGRFQMENADVIEFINRYQRTNARWVDERKTLLASRGINQNWDPQVVHVPPVDTGRYPYFAFVRKKPGFIGGSSEVSMITARNEAQLRALTDKVPTDYDVYFKSNTKEWFKAKGDYDYQLTIKEPSIDSNLQKSGVLSDFFPEVRAENVLEDYLRHIQHQEARVVRLAVETQYAQTFAELRSLGRQYELIGTSKAAGDLKKFKSQVENPFEEYIKTALDISKRSEYTLLHEANEFAEQLGTSAYRMFGINKDKALSGLLPWDEANAIARRYGIDGPYRSDAEYIVANTPAEKSLTKEFVARANMFMVNFTLRLDMVQSLINVISTPILLSTEMASIKSLVANDSALAGKLLELRTLPLPDGSGIRVPGSIKLMANAVKNFWSPDRTALLERYRDIGAIKDTFSKYHEMIDHFSIKPWQNAQKYKEAGDKAIEIGSKFSGNLWAEEFTRFVSANVMHQLTEPLVAAGKLSLAEQNAYMSIFVNRVQGNYLASQRPIAFQGVVGAAISLFQTYQFNLLQQLFRHVENADKRAVFTLLGMQGGLYGLNGIPLFEAINNHLIGQSDLNPTHRDVYSTAATVSKAITGDKALGDWMMYGTASAFPFFDSKGAALYTRGDINPRHITVLPVTPADIVAVDGSIRLVRNLVDLGTKLVSGANVSEALLQGLEHNGINRPLAGFAQVVAGQATTSKGSLIAAQNDLFSIATLARVAGAKPMDESLALNTYFRLNGYMAADQARLEDLGQVVKTKLKRNQIPTTEELQDFQRQYAERGGRIENYSKAMQRWMTDANSSLVNRMIQQNNTSYSQRMIEIMGGTTLPDYRNQKLPAQVLRAEQEQTQETPQD